MYNLNSYKKPIVVLLLISGLTFLIGASFYMGFITRIARSGIIMFTYILYLLYKKPGDMFFGIFLLSTLLLEILFYFSYYFDFFRSESLNGILCLISYISLFNHLALGTKILVVAKKYFYHLIISLLIGVLAFLKLNAFLSYHYTGFANSILHLSYNIFVVLALLFSFFNYLSKKDNKAIMLFVASISLVLLEFLDLASYYNNGNSILRFFRASFFLLGFYFLYRYITNIKVSV
ncbi:hypothetical protein [uncultured Lacinutrix sp.]|uniref:hypothetical protein n=1 Tax=uncultured Lacinutrix sp. TaxID=574032 RepID=UPI0026070DC5|nr:hypothetical protein [uncultured Lacinutrix sp.]